MLALSLPAGIVQRLDGLIGLTQHDPGKTIGPFVIAALQVFAALALRRRLDHCEPVDDAVVPMRGLVARKAAARADH